MIVQYDAAGICTRCGSTGYTVDPQVWLSDNCSGVLPCPCHGWRPIATGVDGQRALLLGKISGPQEGWIGQCHLDTITHWQPLPQPPEVGT